MLANSVYDCLTVTPKNNRLRNQLRKLERSLRRKDELSKDLHVIDFEQLKIENQTLNEKIEERNEELLKLRKKTTTTVQVLTHLKEKLQFVAAENKVLADNNKLYLFHLTQFFLPVKVKQTDLQELENVLSTKRDALTHVKHERDIIRSENARLKQQSGLLGSEDLFRDFEEKKRDVVDLRQRVEDLRLHYFSLQAEVVHLKGAQHQEEYVTQSYL